MTARTMPKRAELKPHVVMPAMTREEWLEASVNLLRELFEERGFTVPPVKVACGWPIGKNVKRVMGQCFPKRCSTGDINEIYISPLYNSGYDVLGTLVHELCHAVDDCASKHGAAFLRVARAMGLEGSPAYCGPGEWMKYECKLIEEALGPYPHDIMLLTNEIRKPPKPTPSTKTFTCDATEGDGCGKKFIATRSDAMDVAYLSCPWCLSEIPTGG